MSHRSLQLSRVEIGENQAFPVHFLLDGLTIASVERVRYWLLPAQATKYGLGINASFA
jgi:hypothetical protein